MRPELKAAVEKANLDTLRKLLADSREDVNAVITEEITFQESVSFGNVKSVTERNDTTLLGLAVKFGHEEIVEALLENGAKADSQHAEVQSPFAICAYKIENQDQLERYASIACQLVKSGANLKSFCRQKGMGSFYKPLDLAFMANHQKLIFSLIERGEHEFNDEWRGRYNEVKIEFNLTQKGTAYYAELLGRGRHGDVQALAELNTLFAQQTRQVRASVWGKFTGEQLNQLAIKLHDNKYGEAAVWFYDLASKTNSDAKFNLAAEHFFVKNYRKAIELFAQIENQYTEAKCYLGRMHYYGSEKNRKDYILAKKYFEEALESGDQEALYFLGSIYYEGLGVEKDFKRAFDYFDRSAAEENDPDAQYHLGLMYYHGEYVSKKFDKAISYFRAAMTDKECVHRYRALYYLGEMYFRGEGLVVNVQKALDCFHRSANAGFSEAEYALGELYRQGHFGEPDLFLAVKWYARAKAHGHSQGSYRYAKALLNGEGGLKKNPEEARKILKRIAQKNHEKAQRLLENDLKPADPSRFSLKRKAAEISEDDTLDCFLASKDPRKRLRFPDSTQDMVRNLYPLQGQENNTIYVRVGLWFSSGKTKKGKTVHDRLFRTVKLKIDGKKNIHARDLNSTKLPGSTQERKACFNEAATARIRHGRDIFGFYKKDRPALWNENRNYFHFFNYEFSETQKDYQYSHSEQILEDYFDDLTAVEALVNEFEELPEFKKGCKVYGVEFEIVSNRKPCPPCKISLGGWQNPKKGEKSFGNFLEKVLNEKGYRLPTKVHGVKSGEDGLHLRMFTRFRSLPGKDAEYVIQGKPEKTANVTTRDVKQFDNMVILTKKEPALEEESTAIKSGWGSKK